MPKDTKFLNPLLIIFAAKTLWLTGTHPNTTIPSPAHHGSLGVLDVKNIAACTVNAALNGQHPPQQLRHVGIRPAGATHLPKFELPCQGFPGPSLAGYG
jgi:hypothetical protein